MDNYEELSRVSRELGVNISLMPKEWGSTYIELILNKFKPFKITGHVSIGESATATSLENHEFSYSKNLEDEPVYVFFEQKGDKRENVIMVEDGRLLCDLFANAYGMEYFVSNKNGDYLIAVNWYAIEGVGNVSSWLKEL
ncbi:hypothetical protein OE749_08385 [Aestuariibacter sp. AA17]|uniref:SMI1/KNR4 family protein n=1 Tax=Fluctibacter corallii TaxID=2984329 RepID=A0ABT3A7Q3_9ALTE|nr:hypothetical protein [Aestuariibacter sp. AA17]MCV2884711.1 hypothetical protein [Aestuariibacter sp. AA17]